MADDDMKAIGGTTTAAEERKTPGRRSRRIRLRGFSASATGFLVAFLGVFPLLWMLSSSFKSAPEVFKSPPTLLPEDPTLEGYRTLFQLTDFLVFFRNSVIVASVASTIGLVLSVGAIYGLTRFKFVGARAFTSLTLIIYMIPGILLVIPLFTLWVAVGLADNLISLSLSYVALTLPFSLWMSRSYITTIPIQMEEAALIDGATRLQAFLRITLPQAIPGLIAVLIFTYILSWNEYVIALVLISSAENMTISLGIANLIGRTAIYSWPMLNAAGALGTLPILLIFFFAQKRLTSGLSGGALVG